MTKPEAEASGLAFSSSTSACRMMVSSKSSMCSFFLADTSTNMLEPPHSSGMTPYSVSSWRTRSGLAPGLSILFTATTMGTSAALAWLMASMVCGMPPRRRPPRAR